MKNTVDAGNTQKRIREAFWLLYSKNDISKITTTDIAQLAYIHRNTFYRYYTSVFTLRDSEEQQLIDLLVPYANEQMVNNKVFVKEMLLNILKTNNEKFRLTVKRNAAGFSEKYKLKLIPILQMKFGGKEESKMDDYMIDYILSGSIALIVRFFQAPDEQSMDVVASRIIDYFNRIYEE